jgi:hypothetical protein
VLGAAVVRAMHVVSMQKLTGGQTVDSLHVTAVQLGTCALLFTAGSLVYGESIPRYLSRLDPWRETMFLYLVLVCTVFAFFVQIWAVRRTSPSRVSPQPGTGASAAFQRCARPAHRLPRPARNPRTSERENRPCSAAGSRKPPRPTRLGLDWAGRENPSFWRVE